MSFYEFFKLTDGWIEEMEEQANDYLDEEERRSYSKETINYEIY